MYMTLFQQELKKVVSLSIVLVVAYTIASFVARLYNEINTDQYLTQLTGLKYCLISIDWMFMVKSFFNRMIIVTVFFTIIVCMLLSVLADNNDQQLAFAYQTTMIKDQLANNNNSSPTNGSGTSTSQFLWSRKRSIHKCQTNSR